MSVIYCEFARCFVPPCSARRSRRLSRVAASSSGKPGNPDTARPAISETVRGKFGEKARSRRGEESWWVRLVGKKSARFPATNIFSFVFPTSGWAEGSWREEMSFVSGVSISKNCPERSGNLFRPGRRGGDPFVCDVAFFLGSSCVWLPADFSRPKAWELQRKILPSIRQCETACALAVARYHAFAHFTRCVQVAHGRCLNYRGAEGAWPPYFCGRPLRFWSKFWMKGPGFGPLVCNKILV